MPIASLQLDGARIVNLAAEPTLRPTLRTLGTGLPGYASGWFNLANGQTALLYLTNRRHAVYIPTGLGYALLLSPRDPEAFLAALRAHGGGADG